MGLAKSPKGPPTATKSTTLKPFYVYRCASLALGTALAICHLVGLRLQIWAEAAAVLLVPVLTEVASRYFNKSADHESSDTFEPADSLLLLAYEADWAQLKLPPPVYK